MSKVAEQEEIIAATRAERLELCEALGDLDVADWAVQSLCAGWTVHEVLAHLTLSTRTSVRQFAVGMIKARGNFDRMEAGQARDRATAYRPGELIEQLRESAESTHRAPGSGIRDPLIDLLVHGQDMMRPLGRVRPMTTERVALVLPAAADSVFYGAKKRLQGVRLVATDIDWSWGEGETELRRPAGDLLMAVTGREI